MKRRVVITGFGAVTGLGAGATALWNAALEGRSGITEIDAFGGDWRPRGALWKDFDPEKFITQRKSIKVMARDIQLAVVAAGLAMEHGAARDLKVDRERFGVIVGSGVLNHEIEELAASAVASWDPAGRIDLRKFGEEGLSALFPLWLLKYLPNMSACHVSVVHDLQGPNNTITTGTSAGLQAVGEAQRVIERGWADLMLAGASEAKVNPVGLSECEVLGVLTRDRYRPFDRGASGMLLGEGAGFVLLEELEHARTRGAVIHAELTGFGSSASTRPDIAMRHALSDAGLDTKDISYLQACGLGIASEDLREAGAIESVFGKSASGLNVSASKAVTGFTGFSSGVLDLILSTMALKTQTVPHALNLTHEARPFGFRMVKDRPLKVPLKTAMTNVSGFGGQSASVITQAWGPNS